MGLIVPRSQTGVITHSHSQTVQHTLETADVIVGLHVLVLVQLGDLLHNLSMTLASGGGFHLQPVDQVREPSSSRVELGNGGMRDASWESVV